MRFFRTGKYDDKETRSKSWPPLTEPYLWRELAEPRDIPDRVSVLKRRIAEVESLFPTGRLVADPLGTRTRSPELSPEWPSPSPMRLGSAREVRSWMVSSVCKKRLASVAQADNPRSPAGRLLVYLVDETIEDGAAEPTSCGYFDFYCEPGWNTWIDYYEDDEIGPRLLCYVPSSIVDLAQDGIDANPVACIHWIECDDLIPPR